MPKPVRSIINQYRGINAHLHSYWQSKGGWNEFHTTHIGDLAKVLKAQLLPMGYTAGVEPSLQIRRYEEPIGQPESDVTIYDLDPHRAVKPSASPAVEAPLVLPIPLALGVSEQSEKDYSAVGVYSRVSGKGGRGEPVAWIELLSPSNKPGGSDARTYREKRLDLIRSGLVFIELDYLHESPTTMSGIADYVFKGKDRPQPGSHAYHIFVTDPRPEMMKGSTYATGFDADDPIPTVTIPLSAGDVLKFDFGAPYRKTYLEMLYGQELVDYSRLPLNFDRYSDADQSRIAARVVSVLKAARQGLDLEQGPFPVEPLTLDEALAQIAEINATE